MFIHLIVYSVNPEKTMAPHSSTIAWKIPRTEEPGSPWVTKSQAWQSDFTFTFHFHALEKEMATHSSVLSWRIPGTGEPGGLPSMGSHRVGHDWCDLAAAAALSEPKVISTIIFHPQLFLRYASLSLNLITNKCISDSCETMPLSFLSVFYTTWKGITQVLNSLSISYLLYY